jgi:hypothetical protein
MASQSGSTVYPHVKYIREYYTYTASREKHKGTRLPLYKGRGTKMPQPYTKEGTTQQMSRLALITL